MLECVALPNRLRKGSGFSGGGAVPFWKSKIFLGPVQFDYG